MHQYLFFIGDFPIRSYGMILCLSIFLATSVAYYFAKQDGRWHEHIVDMGLYCGLAGLIGARLWDVFFFDWDYYQDHLLEIPFVWQGGMAIQGGVIFGVLAGIYYTKKHNIDTWALADMVAPAIILGQAVGRMANLLNGDAFGGPTGSDFGIIYPEGTLARTVYGNQPLWPAEVWEGQIDVIIFALLLLFKTTNYAKGQVFILYAFLYSTARFFLEFLRGDYTQVVLFGLKSAQITSLLFALTALVIFFVVGFKSKEQSQVPVQVSGITSNRKRKR